MSVPRQAIVKINRNTVDIHMLELHLGFKTRFALPIMPIIRRYVQSVTEYSRVF